MLIILFGLSAAGKNYVGKTLAHHFPFYFWDADSAMPEDMKESILNKQVFTQDMRDRFTQIMIEKISELQKFHPNIIIAQGLYKEKNRLEIYQNFPDTKFIFVDALPENILIRLKKRGDWIDETYATKMSANFEKPNLPHLTITNNAGEASIIEQFNQFSL